MENVDPVNQYCIDKFVSNVFEPIEPHTTLSALYKIWTYYIILWKLLYEYFTLPCDYKITFVNLQHKNTNSRTLIHRKEPNQ